jgi:hypothetical protein
MKRERLIRVVALEKKMAADIARLQKRGHVFGQPSQKKGQYPWHPEGLKRMRQEIKDLRKELR